MADFWIITRHPFFRHATLADAITERDRIAEKAGKPLKIYHVQSVFESTEPLPKTEK